MPSSLRGCHTIAGLVKYQNSSVDSLTFLSGQIAMHLLFDLDGTLTDPFDGITRSIVHALHCLDRPSPDPQELRWCIGPSLRISFAKLLDTTDAQLVETAVVKYRDRFGRIGLYENKIYNGIPQILQTLVDDGHSLYVATAKPTHYAQKILQYFGLQIFFNRIYGSELDGTRSDKADLIAHILNSEALFLPDVVMIGDHAQDMIGAVKNGVAAIGVLWGYGAKDELDQAGAVCTIASPYGLGKAIFDMAS